jgi:hypothetical protein
VGRTISYGYLNPYLSHYLTDLPHLTFVLVYHALLNCHSSVFKLVYVRRSNMVALVVLLEEARDEQRCSGKHGVWMAARVGIEDESRCC